MDGRPSIIRVSSSIENWKEKIQRRYNAREYKWLLDRNKEVLFFGLYRPRDWIAFLLHRGKKTVIWCGSDILQVGLFVKILRRVKARHICENELQQGVLRLMLQQEVEVRYNFLSDPKDYPVSYKHSNNPHVWVHINRNSELEAGWRIIDRIALSVPFITFHIYGRMKHRRTPHNVILHGYVDDLDEQVKDFQASIRFHEFDGISEVMTKSILMGQHPISKIRYPHVDTFRNEKELIDLLGELRNKKEPNKYREYYLREFERSLYEI